jgi:23S rRNA pseudouridine1911/1915/1917 synthase
MKRPPLLVVRFEDKSMVVIDKPAGLHTAPLRAGETDTLLAGVIDAYPEVAALPGLKSIEPGLVHRLDCDTSGLIVVARTTEAFTALRASFAQEAVIKRYHACCACADPAALPARIASRFAPYGRGRAMVRVVPLEERTRRLARNATRETYVTEARWVAGASGSALLEASITRGFRHQVRAHLSFLGFPIYGDALYGAPVPSGSAPRMYLHAWRIEMRHPVTGLAMVVESPAPPEFAALIAEKGKENGHE